MTETAGTARVIGPVTGGQHGWAFGSPAFDVSYYRYTETEYFLEGTATRYRPVGDFGPGGGWDAEPAGSAPFRTRMTVYLPTDPSRFNGTVVVGWNNVSSGSDLASPPESRYLFESGFGLVTVTTQCVGVEGLAERTKGLRAWDPERYGSLSHPNDDHSFDIFSQVGRVIGPARSREGIDPMAGLEVKRLIGQGASQSAEYLATYVNAVHPHARVFDGFLLALWFANGAKLDKEGQIYDPINMPAEERGQFAFPMATVRIRPDTDVPVFVINSETEAAFCFPVRRPDDARYRYWETAGTAHVSRQAIEARTVYRERDGVGFPVGMEGTNELPIGPVYDAGYSHMHHWLATGEAPPIQPRIEFEGDPPVIARDSLGLAKGGIRLPQADVPLAQHSSIPWSESVLDLLRGSTRPFAPGVIRDLYVSRDAYLERFKSAAEDAVSKGGILAGAVPALVAEAGAAWPAEID